MHMADWVKKLHAFFELNERPILEGLGNVSSGRMKDLVRQHLQAHNRTIQKAASKPSKQLARASKLEQKQLRGYRSKPMSEGRR